MVGTLRSVECNGKGCSGGVKAELFDGTDSVMLVWLGQRRIPANAADLRAGRGMGLALAAELNGYPGPSHLLELSDRLGLTSDQHSALKEMFDAMKAETIPIGEEALAQKVATFRRGLDVDALARGLQRAECTQAEADKRGLSRVECDRVLVKECEEAERRGLELEYWPRCGRCGDMPDSRARGDGRGSRNWPALLKARCALT